MNDLVKEKNQLEQEMREIYDKRESVAQWEAQISEIIKWWVFSLIFEICISMMSYLRKFLKFESYLRSWNFELSHYCIIIDLSYMM